MKLKKILASLTAAALAVTTMAFAPISVSAEDYVRLSTGSLGSAELEDNQWATGIQINNPSLTLDDKWSDPFSVNGYSRIEVDYTCSNVSEISNLYLVAQGGTMPNAWYQAVAAPQDSGTVTLSFSDLQDATYQKIVFSVQPIDTYNVGDMFDPGITVTEARLYSNDTTDYSWQTIEVPEPEPESSYNYKLPGKFILDNISGANSGIEITYITDGTNWEGFNLVNNAGGNWTKISSDFSTSDSGSHIQFIKFSDLTGELPSGEGEFYVSVYNGGVLSSIRIKNEASKGKVYDASTPATGITLAPTSLSFKLGDAAKIITAAVEPANTTDTVEWSIDDDTVAEITASADGLSCTVTPKKVGSAIITAKANDDVSATCTVTVKKATQPVIISVNNSTYGTASPDKTEAAEGETVKISAEPEDGYQFDSWQVITGDVGLADAESANTSFTMPASEVEIQAVFSEIPAGSYAVVVKAAQGGSAKASAKSAVAGTEITLTVTPDKGYAFDKWIVSPETVVIENDTFTMPDEAVTITPVFGKINYSVEVDVTEGGTASADKTTAQMGDTVKITAVPEDGYILDSITVNGTAISGTSFEMPAEDVVVGVSFKEEGSAGVNVEAPDGVDIGFAGDVEDVLAAIFGKEYASLIEAGYKLDVVMTVKDESAVSDEDKALITDSLENGEQVGLILDVTLIKTVNGVSEKIAEAKSPVSFIISVPDSIIADGRDYSVVRIHNGKAENIGGSFNREAKTITVSSDKFSTYAIVYKEGSAPAQNHGVSAPEPVKSYSIASDARTSVSTGSAAEGTLITVKVAFGYDAYVYCGSQLITRITDKGGFAMPAGNVRIVTVENGYLAMICNAAPNSYIFVYDADMNYIKTNGSVKGIRGEGKVTVKLGEEYAGMTVTLYKGRKSTSVKLDSKTLDDNGNASFTVEGGKNYTAVVE